MNLSKLRFVITPQLARNWVGDWDKKKNRIYLHPELKDIDLDAVGLHEFVEAMISKHLGIPDCERDSNYRNVAHGLKNSFAHLCANMVEKYVLNMCGYSWEEHERFIRKLSKKRNKENVNRK